MSRYSVRSDKEERKGVITDTKECKGRIVRIYSRQDLIVEIVLEVTRKKEKESLQIQRKNRQLFWSLQGYQGRYSTFIYLRQKIE